MSSEILAILGALITFLLSVNAWYFKDVVKTLTEIKVVLAKLTTEHDANTMILSKHDKEIERLREKIHHLEGTLPTMRNAINMLSGED